MRFNNLAQEAFKKDMVVTRAGQNAGSGSSGTREWADCYVPLGSVVNCNNTTSNMTRPNASHLLCAFVDGYHGSLVLVTPQDSTISFQLWIALALLPAAKPESYLEVRVTLRSGFPAVHARSGFATLCSRWGFSPLGNIAHSQFKPYSI